MATFCDNLVCRAGAGFSFNEVVHRLIEHAEEVVLWHLPLLFFNRFGRLFRSGRGPGLEFGRRVEGLYRVDL